MKEKLIPADKANQIYSLLVEIGGASERMRGSFIYHHCENEDGCGEWRFQGKLGFGGKYYSGRNVVDCYTEDRDDKTTKIIEELNEKLSNL